MKTIVLIRHAKSGWDDPELADFERPLNKRGFRDAPFMGNILRERNIKPDMIISSPANRAITTAKIIAGQLGFPEEKIIQEMGIYENGSKYLLNLISKFDNSINTVALFGHNPDITSLSSYLSGDYFENVPTCGTVCIDFDFDNWRDAVEENGELRFFEFPKKFFAKKKQKAVS